VGLAAIQTFLTNICNKAKATVIREDLFIYLHMQNAGTMRITNIKTVNIVQKKRQQNVKLKHSFITQVNIG